MLRAARSRHFWLRSLAVILVTVAAVLLVAGTALARLALATSRDVAVQTVVPKQTMLAFGDSKTPADSGDERGQSVPTKQAVDEEEENEEQDGSEEGADKDTSFFEASLVVVRRIVHPPGHVSWKELDCERALSNCTLEPVLPPPEA